MKTAKNIQRNNLKSNLFHVILLLLLVSLVLTDNQHDWLFILLCIGIGIGEFAGQARKSRLQSGLVMHILIFTLLFTKGNFTGFLTEFKKDIGYVQSDRQVDTEQRSKTGNSKMFSFHDFIRTLK